MLRNITLISLLVFVVSLPIFAQSKKVINGVVVDKSSGSEIRMASILNLTLGKTTVSRGNGTFEMEAAIGHIIVFAANGFYTDTIILKATSYNESNIILSLRPLPTTLTDVTVVSKVNQYQMDSLERRKSFLEDVGENPIPVVSKANDLGFGIGINLDRWSKKQRRDRKARSIYDYMEEEAYINFRWNEDLVIKYTNFDDANLIAFMEDHRPTYDWLRKNPTDEDLMYYINSSLKKAKRKRN